MSEFEEIPFIGPNTSNEEAARILKPGMYYRAQNPNNNNEVQLGKVGEKGTVASRWGVQEEVLNQLLGGFGAKVFGTMDYASKAIVPDSLQAQNEATAANRIAYESSIELGASESEAMAKGEEASDKAFYPGDPSLQEAIAAQTSDRELFRETRPVAARVGQGIGSVGPATAAKGVGKALLQIPGVRSVVGNTPRYVRSVLSNALTTGSIAAAEADPEQGPREFQSGATNAAVTAAVMYPLVALFGVVPGAVRSRFQPRWGAKNQINMAFNRHDLARLGETASKEELASMDPVLRAISPGYREILKRFMAASPDGTLLDAFSARGDKDMGAEGLLALSRSLTTQSGATRDFLKTIIENRSLSSTERMVAAVDLHVSNLTGAKKDLVDALSASADPYYNNAFDARNIDEKGMSTDVSIPTTELSVPGSNLTSDFVPRVSGDRDTNHRPRYNYNLMSPIIAKTLSSRSGKKAFNSALESFSDKYFFSQYSVDQAKDVLERIFETAGYKNGVLDSIPKGSPGFSLEFLDRVKQKLSDLGDRTYNAGDKNDAKSIGGVRRELTAELDRLDESNGAYKLARNTASSRFDLERAYDLGETYKKYNPADIKDQLEGFSPGEISMYRAGAANNLRTSIEGTSQSGQSPATAISNKTRAVNQLMAVVEGANRSSLKAVFDRERTFDRTQKTGVTSGPGKLTLSKAAENFIKRIATFGLAKVVPGNTGLLVAGQTYGGVRAAVSGFLAGGTSQAETVRMLGAMDPKEVQGIIRSLSDLPQDSEEARFRDLAVQVVAQRSRLNGVNRGQTPLPRNQYQILRQPKAETSLGDILKNYNNKFKSAGSRLFQ